MRLQWRLLLIAGLTTLAFALAVMIARRPPDPLWPREAVPTIDYENPCGVVSTTLAMILSGKESVRLADVRRLVRADSGGICSMNDIVNSIKASGLQAAGVRLEQGELDPSFGTMILHIDGSHFVVGIPRKNGAIVILDPPHRPLVLDVSELGERWKGEAIVIGRSQEDLESFLRAHGPA